MFEKQEPKFLREGERLAVPEQKIEGKEEKNESGSVEEGLVSDILNHPLVRGGLRKYKVFSEAYFEHKGAFEKVAEEEIKQRADEILGEDIIYQKISKLERPVQDEDFIPYVEAEFKEGVPEELARAKKEGRFNEVVQKGLAEREAEKEGWEMAGKLGLELAGNGKICRPHLPRIAENWQKILLGVQESMGPFIDLLKNDERFKEVKEINVFSWLFGQDRFAKDMDNIFGWHSYTKEEMEKFRKEKPEAYKDAQKTGIRVSPHLFQKYLLTGEMPKIGGRWISKEEFIENMTNKNK